MAWSWFIATESKPQKRCKKPCEKRYGYENTKEETENL